MNNNVELCFDWLFQSAAHFKAGWKHREENMYFTTFSRSYIVG